MNNSAIIDLLAVKKGYPIMVLDAATTFSQAEGQAFVFLEPPVEYQKMCKKPKKNRSKIMNKVLKICCKKIKLNVILKNKRSYRSFFNSQ